MRFAFKSPLRRERDWPPPASVNPQAHEAYLLGRYHFSKGDEQGCKQAIAYFERAIRLDPDYAAAYAGLSDAWLYRGLLGAKDFREVESLAREPALKAIALDEQLAEAHISLGNIKCHYDWDWAGSEQELRRALELDPGSLDAHLYYGILLMHLGRHDEAIREGQIAVQLDPVSSGTQSALGRILYRARRYEEAFPHLSARLNWSLGALRRITAWVMHTRRWAGMMKRLLRSRDTREPAPKSGDFIRGGNRACLCADGQTARSAADDQRGEGNPYVTAGVYAALGDRDEAFRILEKAVEERQFMTPLKVDPPLEGLHSDPRWQVRMNFRPHDRSLNSDYIRSKKQRLAGAAPSHEFPGGVIQSANNLRLGPNRPGGCVALFDAPLAANDLLR